MARGEEEGITREEIIEALRGLKKAKASGTDGIENEAHAERTRGGPFQATGKNMGGGELPEEWRKGIINPIHKIGERGEVKNYRRVTLMCTAYKIYATILNERLKAEVEDKLKEGQFGLRKGRGTMNAVYVLNYVTKRELRKKREKLYTFFVDLKAAFDCVDRGRLAENMKEMGFGRTSEKEDSVHIQRD